VNTVAALLLAALGAAPAGACDQVDAAKVQLMLSETGAQWSERGGRVVLEWGWAWDGAAAAQRLGLLAAFAQGDTCLAGRSREIEFYRKGALVGRAGPAGVQLLGQAAPRPAGPALVPVASLAECPK
jgi:hypothetical protein